MMNIALLLAVVTIGASSLPVNNKERCWTDGNGEKAKWFENGMEIVRGRYFYTCQKGRLVPQGCINDDAKRIMKNDKYEADGFQYKCVMDTEGYLYFEPSACVSTDGGIHQPGDTFDHVDGANYYLKCQRDYLYNRPYLSVQVIGCLVGTGRRRIAINETHEDEQGSWWECQTRHTSALLCLKGCVIDGRRVKAGKEWDEGEYTYTCAKKSDRAIVECVGCLNEGRRLRSGDRYMRDESVMQCAILYNPTTGESSRAHNVVGCVERDRRGNVVGERTLGCRWYNVEGDIKYEKTCGEDGKPQVVGCTLQKDGYDFLFVPPNMYTIYHGANQPTIYVACRTLPSGDLESFEFNESDLTAGGFGQGRLSGLRYAVPRGKK